jgi:hypothetical protein
MAFAAVNFTEISFRKLTVYIYFQEKLKNLQRTIMWFNGGIV